jgi:hypothetical protein
VHYCVTARRVVVHGGVRDPACLFLAAGPACSRTRSGHQCSHCCDRQAPRRHTPAGARAGFAVMEKRPRGAGAADSWQPREAQQRRWCTAAC